MNPDFLINNTMKILQLCCVSNLWPDNYEVENIDIKLGKNIFDFPDDYGKNYDLVVSAPPCDQFTKANSLNWDEWPEYFINVARKCFQISIQSGKPWLMENPPGRIESFIPSLKHFRIMTWHGTKTNKEYVIYANFLILSNKVRRYGKPGTINNYTKNRRELWQPDFIQDLNRSVSLLPQL